MDLPGHGRSECINTKEINLHKRAAEYILAVLDSHHTNSNNTPGHSSSAFIALLMATLRPQLIKTMIVVSGQVYFSDTRRSFKTKNSEPEKAISEVLVQMHGRKKANLFVSQFWNFRKLSGNRSFTPDVLSTIRAKNFIIHGYNVPIAPLANA